MLGYDTAPVLTSTFHDSWYCKVIECDLLNIRKPCFSLSHQEPDTFPWGNSPCVNIHRQPDIVRVRAALGIPRVAHVDIGGLLGALDRQLEGVLGVVRVLGLGRDVGTPVPGALDRIGPEHLVRVGAPSRLARCDQEVYPVCFDDPGRLVAPESCFVGWDLLMNVGISYVYFEEEKVTGAGVTRSEGYVRKHL